MPRLITAFPVNQTKVRHICSAKIPEHAPTLTLQHALYIVSSCGRTNQCHQGAAVIEISDRGVRHDTPPSVIILKPVQAFFSPCSNLWVLSAEQGINGFYISSHCYVQDMLISRTWVGQSANVGWSLAANWIHPGSPWNAVNAWPYPTNCKLRNRISRKYLMSSNQQSSKSHLLRVAHLLPFPASKAHHASKT